MISTNIMVKGSNGLRLRRQPKLGNIRLTRRERDEISERGGTTRTIVQEMESNTTKLKQKNNEIIQIAEI